MIKAVLVDEDKRKLEALMHILSEFELIEVLGTFTNPLEAVKYCMDQAVDVVFLETVFSGMEGLQFARDIQRRSNAEVVFVTDDDRAAVEAFELCALDYVLKPVTKKRLATTVKRLANRGSDATDPARKNGDPICRIRCFGRFEVTVGMEGGREEQFKWRVLKAKELFAYLVHHRGNILHKTRIIETLWPEVEFERAAVYLHNCVYHIRKLIKEHGLQTYISLDLFDEGYVLQFNGVRCDAEEWIQETAIRMGEAAYDLDRLERAAALYGGHYLEEEDYPWATESQQRFRLNYNELLSRIAASYREKGAHLKEILWLKRLIADNPYHEGYHEMLLKAYTQVGDRQAILQHYTRLKEMFVEDLGLEPGISIQRWVKYRGTGRLRGIF